MTDKKSVPMKFRLEDIVTPSATRSRNKKIGMNVYTQNRLIRTKRKVRELKQLNKLLCKQGTRAPAPLPPLPSSLELEVQIRHYDDCAKRLELANKILAEAIHKTEKENW
ncbi:hypothetical protein C9I98_09545 [Photobacterium sanctipauli]|uniref:Uncharacterized protein n=2 Tax=Photobacterium sanctipauli TaxID=1342794 RepID=A0A2T3NVL0_9GAMM|nr:hypothetical protein C9I98_09545 [Photobacterium sanctipauli]